MGLSLMNEYSLSFIQSIVLISIYYVLANAIIKNTKIEKNFFNYLFLYHLIFCFIYILYCHFEISDARTTHIFATISEFNSLSQQETAQFDLELGRPFMILIVRYLSNPFQLTFISVTVLFGLISYTGLLILYWLIRKSIEDYNKFDIYLIRIFFFFPSLHFWQMSMSKDSLIFFCICLFILFQSNIKKYFYLGLFSLIIVFLIRPYLIPFFLFFTLLIFLFEKQINIKFKILIFILLQIPLFIILQYSFAYVGINLYNFDINNPFSFYYKIRTIIEESRLVALNQSAGINKNNLSFIYQIFIYLFGPINIFIDNTFYKIASFENIILFFYIIIMIINKKINNIDLFKTILFLTFVCLLILLALRTANYGISMRQKWMILPFLIIFLSNIKKNIN